MPRRSGPQADKKFPDELVDNLKGKLLLTHGLLDTAIPAVATMRLIDALLNANKDFDLVLLPSSGHEPSTYIERRSWDYFVRHLGGNNPPKEYPLVTGLDLVNRNFAEVAS